MSTQALLSALSIACMLLVAILGGLLKRTLRVQDEAQATRHSALQDAIRDQRKSLEDEIRATRSDVRLVVGEVGDHGKKIAGLAALRDTDATRLATVEADVKKLVREGCAHRLSCTEKG